MPNVVCIGEMLIDLCAREMDAGIDGAETFTKAPGGAPANVAVGVARLGERCGFIGAVGDDPFGEFLRRTVSGAGVETEHLAKIPGVRTSLAWIAARSDGRKDIMFYRHPGADMCLSPEHVEETYVVGAEAVHYGSISRIDESPRAATDKARRLASESGALLSYDPNYRPTLWSDESAAAERIFEGFAGAQVAKVSDEEWAFVTGVERWQAGADRLLDAGVELVVRSEGPGGARFATRTVRGRVGGFEVECVEPTGAGDGFASCLIVELLRPWRDGVRPGELPEPDLRRIVTRANAVGALACTQVGAIPSLPTAEQVDTFIEERQPRSP